MRKKRRLVPAILFSLGFTIVLIFSIQGSFASIPKPLTTSAVLCGIKIDNAHLTTVLIEGAIAPVVKVNATSKCNKPQQKLEIIVDLYKTGAPFDHLVGHFISKVYELVPANKIIKMESAYVRCKNSVKTVYFGVTYGHALINGVWNYAPVGISLGRVPIACGT